MSSMIDNQFKPNYVVPPGEILEEELESRGMSQAELAQRTGLAKKTINEIIKAKGPITPESALKFERVFRLPADYWLSLEKNYQEACARLEERRQLERNSEWLDKLPIRQMVKFGWVRKFSDKADQLNEILSFFGIASVEQWEVVWERLDIAYRRSPTFDAQKEAISVWLRQGELEAQTIECLPFDAASFKNTLVEVRELTKESDPGVFIPKLVSLCARSGVAVVFVPELPKTHLSGATRWLSKDKAVIQLSLRHKSDDHLWFTFFHEAGHILKHGKKDLFIEEEDGSEDEREKEANEFASNTLIPISSFNQFARKGLYSKVAIRNFAKEIGVAPGIVIGQLQHCGRLPYTHCNDLKVRFKWAHEK
ncbi:MAG: HigA family addiction module antidote protein [Candidatus Thiodiazotropha sp. (ex Dulcina madagascariensis)]|nr:HigA family addiction module antidote protein [Candidatus Thiodiazotropha sp. (ex Dulcina madagascariensis)]